MQALLVTVGLLGLLCGLNVLPVVQSALDPSLSPQVAFAESLMAQTPSQAPPVDCVSATSQPIDSTNWQSFGTLR